jgi:GNAT superfamily N-acetyltransferase
MLTLERFSRTGWLPGLIADSAALMSREYAARFGVGAAYEAWVVTELAGYFTAFDAATCEWWSVRLDGTLAGCAAIDGRCGGQEAEFRWFCLSPATRGRGLGRRLLREAVDHATRQGLRRIHLHTHRDLGAAVHLYEQAGFCRLADGPGPSWGPHLRLEAYVLDLGGARTAPVGHDRAPRTVRGSFATARW